MAHSGEPKKWSMETTDKFSIKSTHLEEKDNQRVPSINAGGDSLTDILHEFRSLQLKTQFQDISLSSRKSACLENVKFATKDNSTLNNVTNRQEQPTQSTDISFFFNQVPTQVIKATTIIGAPCFSTTNSQISARTKVNVFNSRRSRRLWILRQRAAVQENGTRERNVIESTQPCHAVHDVMTDTALFHSTCESSSSVSLSTTSTSNNFQSSVREITMSKTGDHHPSTGKIVHKSRFNDTPYFRRIRRDSA